MTARQIAILQATAAEAQRIEWSYCKCARVLALAAESLGILTPESHLRLFSQVMENDRAIEELYDDLIVLTREGHLLLGQGNLGGADWGPADPLFTECALTDDGIRIMATLGE
jgi:hypothetical protein